MRYWRTLATLVVPVIAMVTMSAAASAAPNPDTPSPDTRTVVLGSDGPVSVAYICVSDPPPAGYVSNETSVGTGVIHICNPNKLYDAVLSPGQRTDGQFGWGTSHGFYIGDGYCVTPHKWNGSHWIPQGLIEGPTRVVFHNDTAQSYDRWALRGLHRC
ncbi:hypothetical protein [Nonomuraea sp. NPDC049709]|uniref:hypothetical protein n=1 Tax=Nonomuraea sp. NPDC049709 TaxID=3154736 RepID=UPI00343AD32F